MTETTTYVLGASDPEMERAESIVRAAGLRVLYAAVVDPSSGPRRVAPGEEGGAR